MNWTNGNHGRNQASVSGTCGVSISKIFSLLLPGKVFLLQATECGQTTHNICLTQSSTVLVSKGSILPNCFKLYLKYSPALFDIFKYRN